MSAPVVVIGGGIAGIATAGLLARAGRDVTVLEKNTDLGGRAGRRARDGFLFDTGPSWYLMPEVIDRWFRLMGTSAADRLDLATLDPAYRVFFEGDAGPRDVRSGRADVLFEAFEPGAGRKLSAYLAESKRAYDLAKKYFLYDDFATLKNVVTPEVIRNVPTLLPLLTQSLHTFVAKRFADPRLRQILGYPAVFLGSSPRRAPAMYHLMSHLDLGDGVYYPMGGFAELIDQMVAVARAAGARFETGARATRIETMRRGPRAATRAVHYVDAGGAARVLPARAVVGATDLHHVETALVEDDVRTYPESSFTRKDPGPSAILVLLGVRGNLPALAHHNLFFTRDWDENFGRIHAGDTLTDPTSIYVCNPSTTDPSVAPAGMENLFVLIPCAAEPAWGSGGVDGAGSPVVERAADAAIAQIAAWAQIPDLAERVVVRESIGPGDFEHRLNAWRGSALGLAHTLRQSAFFRPGNRSRKISGLHYAGSSVRPGIGVPMCLISAELVADAIGRS